MAVIVHGVMRGVSSDQFDALREDCGWLERPPTGAFGHLVWWEGEDNHVLAAWQDETSFNTFGEERLGPSMGKVGVNVQPEVTFYPAHEIFLPSAMTRTV